VSDAVVVFNSRANGVCRSRVASRHAQLRGSGAGLATLSSDRTRSTTGSGNTASAWCERGLELQWCFAVDDERERRTAVATSARTASAAVSTGSARAAFANGVGAVEKRGTAHCASFSQAAQAPIAPFAASAAVARDQFTRIKRHVAAPADEGDGCATTCTASSSFAAAPAHAAGTAAGTDARTGGVTRAATTTALAWETVRAATSCRGGSETGCSEFALVRERLA
jgi:hypothetical protein